MRQMKLSLIGYGKMGSSIVNGAVRSGMLSAPDVKVYDASAERLATARADGFLVVNTLDEAAKADALLIAVKPKDIPGLLPILRQLIPSGTVLIMSIVAGIRMTAIESELGDGSRIVRIMPNIAASVNEAASVFVPNRWSRPSDTAFVGSLLGNIGRAFRIDDEDMVDGVTGISGSGPAYFFLMMKAMEGAAMKVGIPKDLARALVAQTCKGSGTMVLQTGFTQDELISMVASPGGTTEEALKIMDSNGFSAIVADAVVAAIEKSKKMGRS